MTINLFNVDENGYTFGVVSFDGVAYPAVQQPLDGTFGKRMTTCFIAGAWQTWNKDDHDCFTPQECQP